MFGKRKNNAIINEQETPEFVAPVTCEIVYLFFNAVTHCLVIWKLYSDR